MRIYDKDGPPTGGVKKKRWKDSRSGKWRNGTPKSRYESYRDRAIEELMNNSKLEHINR